MSDAETPDPSASADRPAVGPPDRRALLAAVLSFLLGAVPATIGGLFFLDPILRRRKDSASGGGAETMDGFVKLDITSNTLVEEGPPVASTVIADLDDAWNRFKDVPIGSIWLRRQQGGEIVAFNSICPHLGCSINYRRGENDFHCPCHASSFDLGGATTNDTPPRDMDSLEIVVATDGRPDPNGTELWVKFQNFRRGTPEKKPI